MSTFLANEENRDQAHCLFMDTKTNVHCLMVVKFIKQLQILNNNFIFLGENNNSSSINFPQLII